MTSPHHWRTHWRAVLLPLVLAACIVLVVACKATDDSPSRPIAPAPTFELIAPTATVAPTTATAATAATGTAGAVVTSTAVARQLTFPSPPAGLPDIKVDRVVDAQLPKSPFSWDGKSVVLYDTVNGTEMNLGPGDLGVRGCCGRARSLVGFSPDGRFLAWRDADGESQLLDMQSRERRTLAGAVYVSWWTNNWLWFDGYTPQSVVNVLTGEIRSKDLVPVPPLTRLPRSLPGITGAFPFLFQETPEFRLWVTRTDEPMHMKRFRLEDRIRGNSPLEFDAPWAQLDEDNVLLVALNENRQNKGYDEATILLEVSPTTGQSTVLTKAPNGLSDFEVTRQYVTWSTSDCGRRGARTHVYDRSTRSVTELTGVFGSTQNRAWSFLTGSSWTGAPTDHLLVYQGGSTESVYALYNLRSLRYEFVLPAGAPETTWSRDFRYAAVGPSWYAAVIYGY